MTLILALGNTDQFIQVSDRRLTIDGRLKDDESNKAGTLFCSDGRLVFGFTGLAEIGDFKTQAWLIQALSECAQLDGQASGLLQRLRDRATRDFQTLPHLIDLAQTEKRLSVMFSGYLHSFNPPLAVNAILTNYQYIDRREDSTSAREEFDLLPSNERRPANAELTFIQRVGMWPAMTQEDDKSLRTLLAQRKPATAIIGKATELVREMADRPAALGSIGKQLSVITLPRDPTSAVTTGYYSNEVKYEVFMPDAVYANAGASMSFRDIFFGAVDTEASTPMVVPKVGRNQRCPCGSGKKYKYCHGC